MSNVPGPRLMGVFSATKLWCSVSSLPLNGLLGCLNHKACWRYLPHRVAVFRLWAFRTLESIDGERHML